MCLSVSLSATTITKTIVDGCVPNFMGRFLGGREDQDRVSLRSVDRCGSNGNCLHFILLIVGVASVVECWRQKETNFVFFGEL